jgi:hypothetical protein
MASGGSDNSKAVLISRMSLYLAKFTDPEKLLTDSKTYKFVIFLLENASNASGKTLAYVFDSLEENVKA